MTLTEYRSGDEQSREDAPLLMDYNPERTISNSRNPLIHEIHSPRIIILVLCAIIFTLSFGGCLMIVPSLRLYEDIICHHYYERLEGEGHIGLDGHIKESLCKVDEVQNELNIFLAVFNFLSAIPALLTTVPYGLLADRSGRKLVFVLSLTGIILSACWSFTVMWFWKILPVRLAWLCPLFTFIGGGQAVAAMMFFAVASDVTTDSNRTNAFLLGRVAIVCAEFIAPTVASILMAKSPWIPLTLGLGILVLGTTLIIFIPENTHLRSSEAEELILDPSSDQTGSSKKIKSGFVAVTVTQISDGFKRIHDASTVLHSLPILMLIFSFVTAPVVNQSMDLALRYISKRFSWELRQTGLLVSLRALVNILVLLLIIPSLSFYMTERLHYSSQARDLSLARCSAVMLFVGALTFAASPTIVLTILGMVICTLGGGFVFLTRSLITTLVDKEHVARLYAAIAIVEIVSSIAAGPSIAALFAVGLKLKGPWLALPFYALALVCFVSGIGVWCFRLPTQKREDIPCGDGDHQTLSGSDVFLPKNTAEGRVLDHV